MKNYFKNTSPYIIIILVLIIALILTKQCHRCPVCPEPTTTIITETATIYDTVEITKVIYKPLPKDTVYVEVLANIDTADILKDYHAKKYYNNIYVDDTSAYIAIEDTIFKNELYTSKLTFINRRPTVINTTTYITQYDTGKPFNMGFGGFVGFSGQDFTSGGSIMLTTNKKASYAVSVGYVFDENMTYKPNLAQFTMYWNLK